MHGSEKLLHTVMVAVTAGSTKLPIRVTVKGKTALMEKGSKNCGRITVGLGRHQRGG
jgi:hypothetical protein